MLSKLVSPAKSICLRLSREIHMLLQREIDLQTRLSREIDLLFQRNRSAISAKSIFSFNVVCNSLHRPLPQGKGPKRVERYMSHATAQDLFQGVVEQWHFAAVITGATNPCALHSCVMDCSVVCIAVFWTAVLWIHDAKKLYKELYKSSFPFEHCWHELRDQPKWREEYSMKKQKPKKVATPSVCSPSAPDSINLEDNDVLHNDNVDLERPPGRKAEKERLNKRKNKDRGNEGGSPILILLEDLKEDRKKMNDKKIEMYERSYLQEQEKIDNEKKRTQMEQEKVDNEKERIRMEQLKEEERIMSIDTSGLPSLQAEYLHRRQTEILQKKI
ncbi:hypothetical protein LOK49_LG12G01090 [Camellia lanceoleosa]|uniref:Uncharacterized protein n=1 Tax=Camellia lanceoleosa TaxID=1840588 RepID=A0ACC0FXR8_9ERIC|nr:hypothetical protein LOK49_LG12G01090 [Camellia lanceoleosa]